jgi:hypothetical protein
MFIIWLEDKTFPFVYLSSIWWKHIREWWYSLMHSPTGHFGPGNWIRLWVGPIVVLDVLGKRNIYSHGNNRPIISRSYNQQRSRYVAWTVADYICPDGQFTIYNLQSGWSIGKPTFDPDTRRILSRTVNLLKEYCISYIYFNNMYALTL